MVTGFLFEIKFNNNVHACFKNWPYTELPSTQFFLLGTWKHPMELINEEIKASVFIAFFFSRWKWNYGMFRLL